MSLKVEKWLFFFLVILLITLFVVWVYILPFGKVSIMSNRAGFESLNLGKQTLYCPTLNCTVKVSLGTYQATFRREGDFNLNQTVTIKRFQTTPVQLIFKAKPELKKYTEDTPLVNPQKFIDILDKNSVSALNFTQDKIAFLTQNADRFTLNLSNTLTQTGQKITDFYNLNTPQIYWGQTDNFLLIADGADVYLVDLLQKIKHQLPLAGGAEAYYFSPDDRHLLFSQNQTLTLYEFASQLIRKEKLQIPLNHLVWFDNQTILFFQNTTNDLEFYTYNFQIAQKKLFFNTSLNLEPQNLELLRDRSGLLFLSAGEKYLLDFKREE